MDGGDKKNKPTVEDIFNNFKRRRTALIRALTTDVQEFHQMFDPEKKDLRLYGLPDERWEVNSVLDVPADLPVPTTGLNFSRDLRSETDWLSLIADYSEPWLISLAFYHGTESGFNKVDRERLFDMINNLPILREVVIYAASKRAKDKSSVPTPTGNQSTIDSQEIMVEEQIDPAPQEPVVEEQTGPAPQGLKYYKWLLKKNGYYDKERKETEDDADNICAECGEKYVPGEFWILCDFCEKWFHGKCVEITQEIADRIEKYRCPACSKKRAHTH